MTRCHRLGPRTRGALIVALVAGLLVTSLIALPLLNGGLSGLGDDSTQSNQHGEQTEASPPVAAAGETGTATPDGMGANTAPLAPLEYPSPVQAHSPAPAQADAAAGGGVTDGAAMGDTETDAESPAQAQTLQEHEDAVEAGVDQGIELVQSQGVEVSQEQRAAAVEAASESAAQHQEAEVEQVQEATAGAVHGTLIQEQRVNVTQIQHAVGGATDGALAQHQTATASQLQSATWGATHGAIAQEQRVTVEQLQVATFGAAAGAASEAAAYEVDEQPKIQEAAQGAAYGVLTQYQKLTAEQRQTVTIEHVQHAAIGAASGALEGSSEIALEQEQQIDIEMEQRQAVTIKEIQTAAKGAAKGALVQKQTVTVEQTQSAAWGASAGALKQVQSVHVEQVQQITTPKIEEAAKGAATGAITQSQEATVEQIQAAADGGAQGVLVQRQEVSVTQIQSAAIGASKGAVTSAIQYQVIEIEQVQAVAFGAGEGAVIQKQVVDITQVQHLAMGSAEGALAQHQAATVTQLQVAASTASQETARAIQYQRISVTQLQLLTAETAADATGYAVDQGIDDGAQLVQYVEIELVQRIELIDELEGTASLSFLDQNTTGETVEVASVDLSEGGFVAVYDDTTAALDPEDVIGVSDYLEPGEHADVEIELEEPLEDDRSLVAAVHHDTTDDETFRYVERDGGDDEPYVTEGGAPVLDMAFVTVDPEEPDEPEADLAVSDQTGDGETLIVDEASATVDYVVSAVYDDQRVDSETIDAGETVSGFELDLEPPIESDGPVSVAVHAAADDEVLASDTIEYTLDDPFDPEATLSVSDQTGDGTSVTIDEANASVEYALTVADGDGDGDQLTETEPFPAGEGLENESIELETPLTENALLDVSLLAVEENQTLETASLEYTVDEEFQVEFVGCTRAEVTGSFEEGETVAASTGFYDGAGFGNTIIEDFVTIGDQVEAPFTGTIVFEIGAEDDFEGAEDGEDNITVGVPDYGTFGTYISGISSDEAIPFASIDHPNPEGQACDEEARPDEPSISVAETEPGEPTGDDGEWAWGEDTIDVTFSTENPNEEALPGISEFVEGTTEDEPVGALEPGNQTFTVEWTPVDEDEQLVWEFGLQSFGYEEPLIAETDPAGDVVDVPEPDDPAEFEVDITDTNSPVTQGDPLEIETLVENVGDEPGEQEILLALDGTAVDAETLELGTNPTETITLEADTTEFEPGEYTATVESENDTDETPVTIEEPAAPAEFGVEITGTNSPVEQGDDLQVEALVENIGDEAGEQALEFALDETVVDSEEVVLESGAIETVAFSAPTNDLAPGEYTATVASENETDETVVTVTEPAAAEFSLVDVSAPPTDVAGQQTTVVATIMNTGDDGGTQTVTYSVDGDIIEERSVSLEPGETTVEQFTSALPEGESAHTVTTEDAEQTVTIEGLAVLPGEETGEETAGEAPSANGDQTGDQGQEGAGTGGDSGTVGGDGTSGENGESNENGDGAAAGENDDTGATVSEDDENGDEDGNDGADGGTEADETTGPDTTAETDSDPAAAVSM